MNISWSSIKVKVLGVFLGPGNLEEENWRPRITAVENALNSGDTVFVLSGHGSRHQCLGPFPCVVRGLSDSCSPVGHCGIEYFHF